MSAPRVRKAWRVTVRGYDHESTFYAPTAGKARYAAYLRVSDCNDELSFADIRVRRESRLDITLPVIPQEALNVSRPALAALLHACGATREEPEKCGHRKYFYCSASNAAMAELVSAGLMERGKNGWEEGECYFFATPLGQKTARALCPLYRGDDFAWPEVAA
jgi:hypothetical protein